MIYLYAYNGSDPNAIDVANYMYTSGIFKRDPGYWLYNTQSEVDEASGRSPLAQSYPTAAETVSGDPEDVLPIFPTSLGNDGYVDAIAVFFPEEEGANVTWGSGDFTYTVPATQTTQAAVASADLLTNEVTSTMKTAAAAINLDMRHRMCKVLVQFNSTEDLTDENLPNSTYQMVNVKTALKVTLKTGAVETTGSTGTVTAQLGQPFFIPPQTITAGTELLKFNLRNIGGTDTGIKSVVFKPTSNFEFREGTYYVLNINVGVRYITLTTTIKNWTGETINFDKIIL
jgi:hypothetical protein